MTVCSEGATSRASGLRARAASRRGCGLRLRSAASRRDSGLRLRRTDSSVMCVRDGLRRLPAGDEEGN